MKDTGESIGTSSRRKDDMNEARQQKIDQCIPVAYPLLRVPYRFIPGQARHEHPDCPKVVLCHFGCRDHAALHEIIHCIFMKLFGLRGARIEIAKDPLGLPSLRAVAQGEVWGWKQIVIFLAPFMLLTVVPDLLFFLSDKVHFLFFIIAMCNAAGCCFDVAEVARDINKSRIEGRK